MFFQRNVVSLKTFEKYLKNAWKIITDFKSCMWFSVLIDRLFARLIGILKSNNLVHFLQKKHLLSNSEQKIANKKVFSEKKIQNININYILIYTFENVYYLLCNFLCIITCIPTSIPLNILSFSWREFNATIFSRRFSYEQSAFPIMSKFKSVRRVKYIIRL